jgi:P27 family predicted phage terminase small subunit
MTFQTYNHYVSNATKKYTTVMNVANFKYRIPKIIKYPETKAMMKAVVEELTTRAPLTYADIPMLNRLATSYDRYWDAVVYLSENDAVTVNKKGEEVKHPMVNIEKEAWTQFLTVAKEYGLTVRSGVQINSKKPQKPEEDTSPINKWIDK